MRVTPIKSYDSPRLPTHAAFEAHPELLRYIPKRWQHNPVVLSALAGLCVIVSGCGKGGAKLPPSRVAPIFVHGDGRGGFGCVAVNPPVLLSEAEARQVIAEEAKRAGINFTPTSRRLEVRVPITTTIPGRESSRTRRGGVVLDGHDKLKHISYEFVSSKDFDSWEKRGLLDNFYRTTASSRDILGAAETLRESLVNAGPSGAYAVFYDPCCGPRDVNPQYKPFPPHPDTDYKAWRAKWQARTKDLARDELRAQVRDFIKWLKAQGVI